MTPSNRTELLETLVAHCLTYTFLGKAFFEPPTTELLVALKEDDLFAAWPLEAEVAKLQAGLATLQAYTEDWDAAAIEALKRDYARLFVGPNSLLAPPWESVYRSEERLLFEEETLQVRAAYRQFGMALPDGPLQPDDHFGLELFFVAHLCRLGLDSLEHDDSAQLEAVLQGLQRFLHEHVLRWAEPFLQDVSAGAQTDYYRGLAAVALGSLTHTGSCPVLAGEVQSLA